MFEHRVTAILVVHDGATWLPESVAAIASQERLVDELIAIDTGSVDSSAKLLRSARIPFTTLHRKTGFGEAISHVVSSLPMEEEGIQEWLWILHDDVAPEPNALAALLEAVQSRPNVVMAGPKLLGWRDHSHLLEIGISIATNGQRWTGLEPHEFDQGQRDGIHEVLSVSTAGALIRRDAFEELGGLDPYLSLFRDDVDFGWRARVAGYSVIAVSDAIAYHAEASANERRSIDVAGAFLHRPLLLDRRNAAYVLLANSSLMNLPILTVQLLFGALVRSIGYLFAKLPGYASDELLAVGSLFLHPVEMYEARRRRRSQRFVSRRVVTPFIPSRFTQIRQSISRTSEWIQSKLFPRGEEVLLETDNLDDEDLLTPVKSTQWFSLFRRPAVITITILVITTLLWSRNRFGSISGGALPEQRGGASDLWNYYFQGWHAVGMGSTHATPPWLGIVAIASTIFFGNVKLFFSLFFLVAPLLIYWSAHWALKFVTENRWLSHFSAALYAISPVSIASINSGRFSTLVVLGLLPLLVVSATGWLTVEKMSWRRIFAISLLIGLLATFSPSIFICLIALLGYAIFLDYTSTEKGINREEFQAKLIRHATLLVTPILLTIPWSFELLLHPSRFLIDSGFLLPGGGPNLALIGNPGGPGALPWWIISPATFVLLFSLASVTRARFVAEIGLVALFIASLLSSFSLKGNGTSTPTLIYPGTFMAIATFASITATVILLDKIRDRLRQTHVNYKHISAALLVVVTSLYSVVSLGWVITSGASSPLLNGREKIMPAFLAVETNSKTLVLRVRGENQLNFYIARGGDITIGDPDVAPRENSDISAATRQLVDSTGLNSSAIFAKYGIKYVFLKNPADREIIRSIDGLGGFTRASSTNYGIVWKVVGATGQFIFTDSNGVRSQLLENSGLLHLPGAGTLTLTESYSRGWKLIQDGKPLMRLKNDDGLTAFSVDEEGDAILTYDGRVRRAWVSLNFIVLLTVMVMALPAGRRKREISEMELS